MVYSISNNLIEEKENWDANYSEIVKRFCFKKFDTWIEQQYSKSKRQDAGS